MKQTRRAVLKGVLAGGLVAVAVTPSHAQAPPTLEARVVLFSGAVVVRPRSRSSA